MHRRQVLAASASLTLPLAGCLGQGLGTIQLGQPRDEVEADGREKHLVFTRDGTKQAVFTVQQRLRSTAPEQRIPFRVHVWHRQGLSLDRLYVKLRAPPIGVDVPADIYLKVPDSGPWPEFDLRKEDNLWSVIAADDIGELGKGSLGLDFMLEPTSDPVETLAVRAEVEFSNQDVFGPRHIASVSTQFDIVRARN